MAEQSNATSQQFTEVNSLNAKALFDFTSQLQAQALLDNQANARAVHSLELRRAQNAATVDHLAQIGLLQAGQTGFTENQAAVSPVRTATGDAIVGGVGVSAEQVAANISALSDVTVKLAEIATVLLTAAAGVAANKAAGGSGATA